MTGDAFGPRSCASRRAAARLALPAAIAIALTGCEAPQQEWEKDPYYGPLRMAIFERCMASVNGTTPHTIADRGSWSEVVYQCEDAAFYQTNTCSDRRACLAAIATEARRAETSGSVEDEGAGPEDIAR